MPRVSNAPRTRVFSGSASTPAKASVRIPLNDDRQEKANRLQSRKAHDEAQLNQIKAAATPLRKRKSLGIGASPHTPAQNDEDDLPEVGGAAVTPMKRVPILANFEEWMKMATDNKINATNSWNFALIDYFHDMSLLKEGDGVNFQKASCTLDGCVKIYTNRVDSVATETGKLLSGLADSGNKKKKGEEDEEGENEDEEEEGEDGVKRRKKKTQRTAEATLATSFAQLQLKKMELEFSVDPLFKKASADFDEGGAKGLLLNHLGIDADGRIVFDSSDDTHEDAAEDSRERAQDDDSTPELEEEDGGDIDIAGLASKFFPEIAKLDEQDICPSLKGFDLGNANGSLDLPFLKAPEDWRQDKQQDAQSAPGDNSGVFLDDNAGFDDDDAGLAGFDVGGEVGFGEGGDAWAREAALEPQMRVHDMNMMNLDGDGDGGSGEVGGFDPEKSQYAVSLRRSQDDEQENILNYFDNILQKNWAGPEHWKIRRVKDAAKAATTPSAKRKEKEPFEIDFMAPMSQALADALYTPASSSSTITLPKKEWRSRNRNLLPDDKHFNSRQLLRLFLKPKAMMGSKKHGASSGPTRTAGQVPDGEVDENYWARQENLAEQDNDGAVRGDYDADFFQDDGLPFAGAIEDDDVEFADAREQFSPLPDRGDGINLDAVVDAVPGSQEGAFGQQLVTQSRRLRPEYVQYARVAKKVDVRRLKEEIWKGLAYEDEKQAPAPIIPTPKAEDGSLKFTDVINNLQNVYPKQAMADISTSYCFICVLHLANEKGLEITNEDQWTDLTIKKDHAAEIVSMAD